MSEPCLEHDACLMGPCKMTDDRRAKAHKHYWLYPYTIIAGRTPSEVAVVRYCHCGTKQVAFAKNWRKATGDYALPEHYRE